MIFLCLIFKERRVGDCYKDERSRQTLPRNEIKNYRGCVNTYDVITVGRSHWGFLDEGRACWRGRVAGKRSEERKRERERVRVSE